MNEGDAFLYAFISNKLTELDLLGYRESTTAFSVGYCNFLVNVTVNLFAFL